MNTLSNIIPNPLLINKTLNSNYSLSAFATSDFNGKENTSVIRKYNDNIIPNRLPDNMFVGSIGELGLIMENISYINNIIEKYNGNKISLNAKYASSTFYSENTVNSNEYNIGSNIDELWYYNTYNGMIGKDKITNTFNSLPIYKFNISDFTSEENYYSDESINRIKLFTGKDFDICSYIIYCQDDTLDNLDNTLSSYYFTKIDTNVIQEVYEIIHFNDAFENGEKTMTIAPQSFEFSKSCTMPYFENALDLYVKDKNNNIYYKVNTIINNEYSINTDVYLDYNENIFKEIDINYDYNGEKIRINKEVKVIEKDEYLNNNITNSQGEFLICTDTNVNVLRVHFVNINETTSILSNSNNIEYYENKYKKENVSIINKNNIIDNVIPYNIKYITSTENETGYQWKSLNTNMLVYSFTNPDVLVLNNDNNLEIIGNGETEVTVKFYGGHIEIRENQYEYFEPFEITCKFNIDINDDIDSNILENFVTINIIDNTEVIKDIDFTENIEVITNENINDFGFVFKTNDDNNGIFSIIKNDSEDQIYELNGLESVEGIYKIYDGFDLYKFYSFIRNRNNVIIDFGYFTREKENEQYTNQYRYISGFDNNDNNDKHAIISNLINKFLQIEIYNEDNQISYNVIRDLTFTRLFISGEKIVIPFTLNLYYLENGEYRNGKALLNFKYKYVTPSESYQIHDIILSLYITQGNILSDDQFYFRYEFDEDNTAIIENISDSLPTLIINDNLREFIYYKIEAHRILNNNEYEIIDNIYASFNNENLKYYYNTPEDVILVIKCIFNGNIEYRPKEISYNLIVNILELEKILEIHYSVDNNEDINLYNDISNEDINLGYRSFGLKSRSNYTEDIVFGENNEDNTSYKKAKYIYIEYDFSYYLYFTVGNKKYLLETNNDRINNLINNGYDCINVIIVNNNELKEIVFYVNNEYRYGSIYIEYSNITSTSIKYILYKKSNQSITSTIFNNSMTSIDKSSIIKYPIYVKDSIYSIPLLPSKKVGNYYECEFFIILPFLYIKGSDNKIKEYSIDNIYNNIVIILQFGDNEIKEILKPYKKCNDVIIYKFKKVDLFDYTFIQNQELKIFFIDYGESIGNTIEEQDINNRIVFYQKMFFNIFKFNLQQGKYQNMDFRIKYNNYYPLKYPIKTTKQRYLNLNYIPLEKLSDYDPNTLNSEVNFAYTSSINNVKIDIDNLVFNYSYLNTYNFKNISETNDILSWFLEENGNGLRIGLAYGDSYSNLSLTLENIVGNKYNMGNFQNYVFYKNFTYYDEFGILSGVDDDLSIKKVKSDYDNINNEISLDFSVYGMKEIIYMPYDFEIPIEYKDIFIFNKENNATDNDGISVFEDLLYIYNNTDEKVSIYFTDESHVLCDSTRKITLIPKELRKYKPSKHTDYNIIIKTHNVDNYILKYLDFESNMVSSKFQNLNINNCITSDHNDIVTIHIYEYHQLRCGHIVTINPLNEENNNTNIDISELIHLEIDVKSKQSSNTNNNNSINYDSSDTGPYTWWGNNYYVDIAIDEYMVNNAQICAFSAGKSNINIPTFNKNFTI